MDMEPTCSSRPRPARAPRQPLLHPCPTSARRQPPAPASIPFLLAKAHRRPALVASLSPPSLRLPMTVAAHSSTKARGRPVPIVSSAHLKKGPRQRCPPPAYPLLCVASYRRRVKNSYYKTMCSSVSDVL
jgi:hypothetical protein